jgi:hypothetical protein
MPARSVCPSARILTLGSLPGAVSIERQQSYAKRLSRNVRQPNQILSDEIAAHQVERRPGAGEEWPAAPKHNGAEVESILIDKAGLGQASRQDRAANVNLAGQFRLQPAYRSLEVIRDQRGVAANRLE